LTVEASPLVGHAASFSETLKYRNVIFKYLPLSAIPAILGGLAFTNEFPEKFVSDRKLKDLLSYIGNGHNLMHVLVAISLVASHRGMSLWVRVVGNVLKRSI